MINHQPYAWLISLSLLLFSAIVHAASPLQGQWQIMSYQVIGYPALTNAEADIWLDRTIHFTAHSAQLQAQANEVLDTCHALDSTYKTVEAEAFFLIGYEVKPARLGVTAAEVEHITLTCQHDSWLRPGRTLIRLSKTQLLLYWEGIFFFLQQSTEPRLPIMPQSVGRIMPETAFNQATLAQALPQYTVRAETRQQLREETFYGVYQGATKVLDIFPHLTPDAIDQIHIYSPQVLAPGATHPGQSYAELSQSPTPLHCQPVPNTQQVQCYFDQMDMVRYVFQEVPPAATLTAEQLQQAVLHKIIWQAEPALVTEDTHLRPQGAVSAQLVESFATPTTTTVQAMAAVLPLEQRSSAELEALYHQADLRLNQVYQRLRQQLQRLAHHDVVFEAGNLITIQRDWIRFRDHNCNWQSGLVYTPNTQQGATLLPCLIRMTENRSDELAQVLQQIQ